MSARGTFRLGTRGSALALAQAERVKRALEERRYAVELVTVETTGDEIRDEHVHRLGKTGAFVRSIDERVLDGELDGAIHSLKDVPTDQPDELVIAATPERASPTDVLITPNGDDLSTLEPDAVVGTSSLRRRAQLLAERPDLSIEALRGNVDSRLETLLGPWLRAEREAISEADDDGPSVEEWTDSLSEIERSALDRPVDTTYDGIVLAEAGIDRLGVSDDLAVHRLEPPGFVPAPGQGAVAVTAVEESTIEDLRRAIDHPRTRVETATERIILARVGGGCIAPIGVYAVVQGSHVCVYAQILDADGDQVIAERRMLPIESYPTAAHDFATELRERGASELIEEATRESETREAREEP